MANIKNIPIENIFKMTDSVEIRDGEVVSKTLVQNDSVSITLFAFDKDEEIAAHTAKGDAFVTVLYGTGKFTVDGKPHVLHEGESIVMPAGIPHSLYAVERFKMLLVVVNR